MKQALTSICIILILSLAAGASTVKKQKPLDRNYIDFRLKHVGNDMRFEIAGLQYLLTPSQLDELLCLYSDDARRYWIDDFWAQNDPVYTTAVNEIKEEHYQRVEVARWEFSIPKWPLWDHRGEVFIRYGPPTTRQIFVPEINQFGPGTPPSEHWYYIDHDMLILFEDVNSSGEFTYYLKKIGGWRGVRMDRIWESIDAPLVYGLPPTEISVDMRREAFQSKVNKFHDVVDETPSTTRYHLKQYQLPLYFSFDNFRGSDRSNRADVNFQFFADRGCRGGKRESCEYIATAVIWDTDHIEVDRKEQSLKIPTVKYTLDSLHLFPSLLTFTLPPGFYQMALTVEDRQSRKIASYKTHAACPDLATQLAVSDILFARKIVPATRNSLFNRGALEVIPHPIRHYKKPTLIPIYFEIYNLDVDSNNQASYMIEYRVQSKVHNISGFWNSLSRDDTPYDISSSFQSSCTGPSDPVQIAFSTDNLSKGEYVFQVKITDERTQTEVIREEIFNIIE